MARDRLSFGSPEAHLAAFGVDALARIASAAGDVALITDARGQIIDVSFASGDLIGGGRDAWIGKHWIDTVTVESRPKIEAMLAAAGTTEPVRWRQVNHPSNDGDVPVRYLAIGASEDGNVLAIGLDMRTTSVLQQRLIQTQQSLERDYMKLRQAEARYRLLFELENDAVVIVEADSGRIREANPATHRQAGAKPGTLANRPLTVLIDPADHAHVLAHLGRASVSDAIEALVVKLAGKDVKAALTATAFRQDRALFFLVRLIPGAVEARQPLFGALLDAVAVLPDAVVMTDAQLGIVYVNAMFLDLSQEALAMRLDGTPLGTYLGRAGIDLELMVEQVRQHGSARNVATIMRGKIGAVEEVEVSAVAAPGEHGDGFAFSIRPIGRRARDGTPSKDLPRSVEQLTELVGRVSLKDIVRESTDLIERLCIEAALEYTSDNRASAAEILGVSRQSLYSKLHRHGLGNLVSEED